MRRKKTQVWFAWVAWFDKLGSALVDAGNPISPKAKNISSDGKVNDGQVGSMAKGYSVIKADSLEATVLLTTNGFITGEVLYIDCGRRLLEQIRRILCQPYWLPLISVNSSINTF